MFFYTEHFYPYDMIYLVNGKPEIKIVTQVTSNSILTDALEYKSVNYKVVKKG